MKIDATGKTSKLAAQVILEARKNLKQPEHMLEVALWFVGRDFPFWAEIANVPFADPLKIFQQMNVHNARILLSKLKNANLQNLPDGYSMKQVREAKSILVPLLYEIVSHGRAVRGTNKQHGSTRIRNSQ